ncbi:MAG TPA: OB-fold domain-containing protein [Ilumatobacteraceae bacterium]|jgi:hypothetical protein
MSATGEVRLQRCSECGSWNVPARVRCPIDPAHHLVDTGIAGTGIVFSYTVTHVAMNPAAADQVPYVTTLVELSEGPRLVTHFAGDAGVVRIGMPVTVAALDSPSPHMPAGALLATPQHPHITAEVSRE